MRKIDEADEQEIQLRKKKRQLLAAVALGVICVSFYGWWRKTAPPADATIISKSEIVEASRKVQAGVIVYVSGRVEHPGLVKVQAGARALDAVNAAGGLLSGAEISKVNLAQTVRDGMQINVPGQVLTQSDAVDGKYPGSPDAKNPAKSSKPAAAAVPGEKININTADAEELNKLPGVGPAMAAKIIEWRKANGPFRDEGDLKKVKGIGDVKYQKMKNKISW